MEAYQEDKEEFGGSPFVIKGGSDPSGLPGYVWAIIIIGVLVLIAYLTPIIMAWYIMSDLGNAFSKDLNLTIQSDDKHLLADPSDSKLTK